MQIGPSVYSISISLSRNIDNGTKTVNIESIKSYIDPKVKNNVHRAEGSNSVSMTMQLAVWRNSLRHIISEIM